MGAKEISQLQTITKPSKSALFAVVDSGVTYNTTFETVTKMVTDVTYSELVSLINTSGLTHGQYYRITDFQTTYWMLDGEGNECNNGVPMYGEIEPLTVLATSQNTIDTQVFSEIYHTDIILYDWDPLDYVDDFCFSNLPNFKGVILWRKETIFNISAGWDIRSVKFRRWKSTAPIWVSGTTYYKNDIVLRNKCIYKALDTNENRDPVLPSSSNFWVAILNLTYDEYWNSNATGITFDGITIPSLNSSITMTPFLLDNVGSYNKNIPISIAYFGLRKTRLLNNIIKGPSHDIIFKESVYLITIGTGCVNIDIRYGCFRMIFGTYCSNILIRPNCSRNIFSDGVYNVDMGLSCNNNLFGQSSNDLTLRTMVSNISFGFNCSSITIGSNSNYISFDEGCSKILLQSDCSEITMRSFCSIINFSENCRNILINSISTSLMFENSCHDLIIPMTSTYNKFESNSSGNLDTPNLRPYLTANHCCAIFRNSALNMYLRYFDGYNNNNTVFVPIP